MTYDFDRMVDRKGKYGDTKWNLEAFGFHSKHPDPIAMWVADMDIKTPDFVIDAMRKRLDHPVFGYFFPDDRYYNSILRWQAERNGVGDLKREHILYQNGVLGAIDTAVECFTRPGESVLVQSPGYHQFKNRIDIHGRQVCPTPLRRVDGIWRMDLEDMERRIVENSIRLAILCTPHNPTGRVWTREELDGFIEVCYRHNVTVIADEIHSDLILTTERKFVPAHSVSDHAKEITITLASPSKTFNLAGQGSAYSIVYNPELAKKYQAASELTMFNFHNAMSVEAAIAAYEQGGLWVDELRAHLRGNMELVRDTFAAQCPSVKAYVAEATYLMWIDFSGTGLDQQEINRRCVEEAGVVLHNGAIFIQGGVGFMRMNIACPRPCVAEALRRLCRVFQP